MKCRMPELNQRHGDFQSPALPTELIRHFRTQYTKKPAEIQTLDPRNFQSTGPRGAAPGATRKTLISATERLQASRWTRRRKARVPPGGRAPRRCRACPSGNPRSGPADSGAAGR